MEAKELRIGNKILFLNEIVTFRNITGIRNDGVFWIKTIEPLIESKNFHFKPIQLTEEWILKFEEFSKTDKEGTPCFFNMDNIMLFDRGSCFDAYLHSEVDGSVFFATRLFYVHQLQNFYHAIEKQELTIKE